MNRICLASGWCAFKKSRGDTAGWPHQYDPGYLKNVWKPQIEKFIKPDEYFIYISDCDIYPDTFNANVVYGHDYAGELCHRHDWYSSVMMGAQYAFCNSMDFVYIEQDCMVHGLDKALEWAQGEKMCYGFGPNASLFPEWAEHSFVYIGLDYIPEMLYKINLPQIHTHIDTAGRVPETIWHRMFKDVATFWPFGYGRKRPIDFNQEVFYAQQLSEKEIAEFRVLKGMR